MSKKSKKLLSSQDIKDILKTLEICYKAMSLDEKKAVLSRLGKSKKSIEALSEDGMLTALKNDYNTMLPTIDLNNFNPNSTKFSKYKVANEYVSRKKQKELKEEIETYKSK